MNKMEIFFAMCHILGNPFCSQTHSLLRVHTDFTDNWFYTPYQSSCQIYQAVICLMGWRFPVLAHLTWFCPVCPPLRSPAGASWKGVCVTGPVSSLLQPEHFINTGTFWKTQEKARHELGMTPPSKVPGEFIWRPDQILCSSSSASLLFL